MKKVKVRFYQKPSCTTCRKAKALLQELGAELESRDLDKEPLSEAELDTLIGTRDYQAFLNPRNELYRERNMGEKTPSRQEAIRLMSKTPNLIKRPVVVRGSEIVLGLDEAAYRKLLR
ncbi:MAG TPA: ArsC/Spx/MgsR family protein [Dongiaceae bacterium]|nr:ArsC/Spx/MgsR family protein [Dongiaceae bacterium]